MPVPYDEFTSQEWIDSVIRLGWVPIDDQTWKLEGRCPRCDDQMSKELRVVTTILLDGKEVPDLPEEVFVACNCSGPHEGRPEGKRGCGPAAIIPGPKANQKG